MTPSTDAHGLRGAEPAQVTAQREKVHFLSGDAEWAAWHYRGTNAACVLMAGGGAVTKEPGTDLARHLLNPVGEASPPPERHQGGTR